MRSSETNADKNTLSWFEASFVSKFFELRSFFFKKKFHRFDVIRRRTTKNNQRKNYNHDVSKKLKQLRVKIRELKQQKISKSQSWNSRIRFFFKKRAFKLRFSTKSTISIFVQSHNKSKFTSKTKSSSIKNELFDEKIDNFTWTSFSISKRNDVRFEQAFRRIFHTSLSINNRH